LALTDNCDIYVAIYDAGINRVVKQVMEQRPSLFNYGTALLADYPQLLCTPIQAAPEVIAAGNPLITILGPLPVISTPYGLNFAAQLTNGEIDFYPGNIISLPPDLDPPLPPQRLAIHFGVCAGIGCPSERRVPPRSSVRPPVGGLAGARAMTDMATSAAPDTTTQSGVGALYTARTRSTQASEMSQQQRPPIGILPPPIGSSQGQNIIVLPMQDLDCFCLDLFATCGCTITGVVGNQKILPSVDGIDIEQLQPQGLETAIECYALVALNQGILPQIGNTISQIAFGLFTLPEGMGSIQVSASTAVPNNPAIEDDQLKAFIDIDEIDLNITISGTGGSGGGGGGGSGGSVTRTTRGRTRTGPFDLTAAVSAGAFTKVFGAVVNGFKFTDSGSGSFGPFSVGYAVAAHLESGSIKLTDAGAIEVDHVVVRWDTLSLTLGFTLPKICTPGFCAVPIPFDGCLVNVPPVCLFSGSPEISFTIDLGGLIDSELTFTGIPRVYYGVGSGVPNRWQIAVEPSLPLSLEIIDIADTVGDLFNTLIVGAIDSLISSLPGWAQDLINSVLGDVDDIIRTVLGIPDDVSQWIQDMIASLGIFQDLLDAISQYIAITIFNVYDPYPVLPAQGTLIPVQLPIQYLGITVDSKELVVEGDIGD
jgi:hypothetical protein